ncbi:formate/nitrite transporter family protein [Gangjinia marincola]|uniref:Formate/nitrite transporter family protein n=1 Tax=Gangjinia marincola TaxID=578463 RepID=A0ABP3XTK4_9FLAO
MSENTTDKVDEGLEDTEKNHSSEEGHMRSHGEILNTQISEGIETYEQSNSSIFLSSLTAGLEIGFSYILLCVVVFFFRDRVADDTIWKLTAFVYPVGFILIVLGKSILFTEQTSLLFLPVLNKKKTVGQLLKLWGVVIAGNLVGGFIMAGVAILLGPALGLFDFEAIEKIAKHVSHYSATVIMGSAILAGWLMGLLSWLLTSADSTISRIVIIYLVTAVIGATGLHHSIVGNIEVFAGMVTSGKVGFNDYAIFQSIALIGNAIGGVVFVAVLKYTSFAYNFTR